jgi:hypothetical protein
MALCAWVLSRSWSHLVCRTCGCEIHVVPEFGRVSDLISGCKMDAVQFVNLWKRGTDNDVGLRRTAFLLKVRKDAHFAVPQQTRF